MAAALFGEHNSHLSYLEKLLDVHIGDRANTLMLSGEALNVGRAENILNSLYQSLVNQERREITKAEIDAALRFLNQDEKEPKTSMTEEISQDMGPGNKRAIKTRIKTIVPRSPRQAKYLDEIYAKDMVFGCGPAGTGKTYLAVAAAVDMFLKGQVERLIFTRPAVEAGENLGFLPGDMKEKVDPYLRPIYDALHDMMPWDFLVKKLETGEIEIAPLAFMRGRTLAHAFVILDEAQNTTCSQMKMFLTRMGEGAHMVITGDPSQTDLPEHVTSGLSEALSILKDVPEISFMHFKAEDVVRHPLVGKIVDSYDRHKD